jgi:hypothetical protein
MSLKGKRRASALTRREMMRFRCILVLATGLVATASCDGSSGHPAGITGDPDAGSKTSPEHGPAASAAKDAQVAGDSGGGGAQSIVCGSAKCVGSATFAPCCVDASRGTCGVENKALGVACGVPAVADPACPAVAVGFAGATVMVKGCCTPSGVCGGFNLGSPCAPVPPSVEDDAGRVPDAPRTCQRRD